VTLPAARYESVLKNAGMQVQERRFRNRLPLAHILFIARKPFAGRITEDAVEATAEVSA
jgi:hypothetical protein